MCAALFFIIISQILWRFEEMEAGIEFVIPIFRMSDRLQIKMWHLLNPAQFWNALSLHYHFLKTLQRLNLIDNKTDNYITGKKIYASLCEEVSDYGKGEGACIDIEIS